MNPEIRKIDDIVASLTAPGQPFELNSVMVEGVGYRNFAHLPANLGRYCQLMRQHADREFAVYRDQRYTFGETWQHSAAFATALQRQFGVGRGDRVAILSRNNPQWMMAFIGIVSVGAVAVPMNAWWTAAELDYGFADCGASVVVADRECAERLDPIASRHGLRVIAVDDCNPTGVDHVSFSRLLDENSGADMPDVDVALDDHATILYTSGSTGHPKGALSSHRGILSALFSWTLLGQATRLAAGSDGNGERFPPAALLTIPLFHCTASHSAFLMSLLLGRKVVIMHRWDAQEALRLIEQERITWFNGVPTMSAELQAAAEQSDRDLSSLSEIMAGGAARPPAQVGRIAETFRQSRPGIGYGLTETNAIGTVNSGQFYLTRPGSAGRTVPPVTDLMIVDADGAAPAAGEHGEICIKSPANIRGYWNKPEATAQAFVDGWFHTGDVGYMDDEGFLYIVDRIKEIIIRGGENISCLEVEAAIYSHPDVFEAAVFSLPDERLGEVVGAAVVLREGARMSAEQLREHLGERLAAFKIPAQIWFRTEPLPRIASGKIFKRRLKSEYVGQLSGAA